MTVCAACEAHINNLRRQNSELRSPCMGCAVLRAERDRAIEALRAISTLIERGIPDDRKLTVVRRIVDGAAFEQQQLGKDEE